MKTWHQMRSGCSCGNNSFFKSVRVTGSWGVTTTVDSEGNIEREEDGDYERKVVEPKTMRCTNCRKRYPNPDCP